MSHVDTINLGLALQPLLGRSESYYPPNSRPKWPGKLGLPFPDINVKIILSKSAKFGTEKRAFKCCEEMIVDVTVMS